MSCILLLLNNREFGKNNIAVCIIYQKMMIKKELAGFWQKNIIT
jgi:hypothetical protein